MNSNKNSFWFCRSAYFYKGLISIYLKFEIRDLWVGIFWDVETNPDGGKTLAIYLCFLPLFPLVVKYYPLDRRG